jgi:hypothetical protein
MSVQIGIHDDDIPPNLHTASNPHGISHHDLNISVEIRAFPDEQAGAWEELDPDAWLKAAALDFDPAAPIPDHRHRPSGKSQNEPFRMEVPPEPDSAPERRERHAVLKAFIKSAQPSDHEFVPIAPPWDIRRVSSHHAVLT